MQIVGTIHGAFGVLLYVAMVTVGTVAFERWRNIDPYGSPPPYAYMLCGPALSLFTHGALVTLPLQTLMLIPMLLAGLNTSTGRRRLYLLAFVVFWLLNGWFIWRVF